MRLVRNDGITGSTPFSSRFAALLVGATLLSVQLITPSNATAASLASTSTWSNRLVITYTTDLAATVAMRAQLPFGARFLRSWGRYAVVDLGRLATPADLNKFKGPSVLTVEPDYRATIALAPNDPSYSSEQWDMSDAARASGDYSVHAPTAWDLTTGDPSIVVAVLDTGITAHAELSGRTVPGYDMVSDPSSSNDGDGRDSDASDPGDYGCIGSTSTWHGTHVAGTIGATGNNGTGIAGLNWQSKIQSVRVLGKCGGGFVDIADGITWASGGFVAGTPLNDTPARIINLSLGGPVPCPEYLQSAVDGARSRGTIVVAAAGNSNADVATFAPANCNGVVSVAATDRDGTRAAYSNYGSKITIAAPGTAVYSLLNSGTTVPLADSFAYLSGTSMAAPHVAGALSLLFSFNPTLSEADAINLMQSRATPFSADSGVHPCNTANTCGTGIVNVGALITGMVPSYAPELVRDPEIAETPVVGSIVSADPGSWRGAPTPSISYRWLRCTRVGSAVSGAVRLSGCTTISGAIGATYTPVSSDAGRRLRVVVQATNTTGTFTRTSATSAIVGRLPGFSRLPTTSGSARSGGALTARVGSVTGSTPITYAYQWFECTGPSNARTSPPTSCSEVASANTSRVTVSSSQVGKYLLVRVIATNAFGSATAYSATSAEVR